MELAENASEEDAAKLEELIGKSVELEWDSVTLDGVVTCANAAYLMCIYSKEDRDKYYGETVPENEAVLVDPEEQWLCAFSFLESDEGRFGYSSLDMQTKENFYGAHTMHQMPDGRLDMQIEVMGYLILEKQENAH